MTKIIGLIQLKGGSGRSTVATNLAAELSKQKTVCLVDADYPQGTSAAWYAVRQEQDKAGALMLTIARNHAELIEKVKRLYDAYDLVVIDTPPRVAELVRATVMISDLLLVPMGPSAAELWATEDLLDTIQEAKQQKGKLKMRVVWNRFREYTKAASRLQSVEKKELKIPAMMTRLGFRVAYPEALEYGLSVAEMHDPKARQEITELTNEILRLLRR